jgi:LPS sulfotransferase NodH
VITIVSGLPRSGTSLMMQMLAAGGIPILTDGERIPDSDNPRGYCEWEQIKLLPKNPALIAEAEGKAVKVISQLLFALPSSHRYKIIFLRRPLAEVLASQAEMIRHRSGAGPAMPEAQVRSAFEAHLNQVNRWLKDKQNISVLDLEYHDLLADPRTISTKLQDFLLTPLDIENMAKQVDPALYRQRTSQPAMNS